MSSFFLFPFYIPFIISRWVKGKHRFPKDPIPAEKRSTDKNRYIFPENKVRRGRGKNPTFRVNPYVTIGPWSETVSPNWGTCNPRSFGALKTSFRTNARLEWKSLVRDNASMSILPLRRLWTACSKTNANQILIRSHVAHVVRAN